MVLCVNRFLEFDDAWVIAKGQNLNLSLHDCSPGLVVEFGFFVAFDCSFALVSDVYSDVHHSVGTFSKHFANLVVV